MLNANCDRYFTRDSIGDINRLEPGHLSIVAADSSLSAALS